MKEEDIAKIIKKIRKDNNLTQKDLAEKLNVSYQAVSKWECGINIPDISILKQICSEYNVSLDKMVVKKKNYLKYLIFLFIIALGVLLFIFVRKDNSNFEFKTISTTCSNFNIDGSIAYNKNKTSIYISHINYCGKENNTLYTKIDCYLYEENESIINTISKSTYEGEGITIEKFLEDLTFKVENYENTCKKYNKDTLYLQLEATINEDVETYKIPLKLDKNC